MFRWHISPAATAAMLLLSSIRGAATAFSTLAPEANDRSWQTFRSSDIVAPLLQVNYWDRTQTDSESYIFIGSESASASYSHGMAAPMILSGSDLSLVYARQQKQQKHIQVYGPSVQMLNGTDYLAFWEGPLSLTNSSSSSSNETADGRWLMYDGRYELKYNFTAKGSRYLEAGEIPHMRVTHDSTLLLATYETVVFDCSAVGGSKDARLLDSGFQELDPATGEVKFEWKAREHLDVSDSYAKYHEDFGVGSSSGFDFFHLSSVEKAADGNYLISGSQFSAIFMISGQDGHVMWTLGGKKSDFEDVSGGNVTSFGWLLDAQRSGNNEILLLDSRDRYSRAAQCKDGKCNNTGRVLSLRMNHGRKTVELVREYRPPRDMANPGSIQMLKKGHALVGWSDSIGDNPGFVEYDETGRLVMDIAKQPSENIQQQQHISSCVRRHRWQGTPSWPPSVAVDAPAQSTVNATVYVSWNGATDVVGWAVLAANAVASVSHYKNVIALANRTGFETAIALGEHDSGSRDEVIDARRYIGVAAISVSGDVLGASFVWDMRTGQAVMQASGITTIRPPVVKATAAAGAMGGSIFGLSMLFYIVNYFWRRKLLPLSHADQQPAYEKVASSSSSTAV